MKVFRASRSQFAVVVTMAVLLQPTAFALCQLNCQPDRAPAAKVDGAASPRGVPCQEHGGARTTQSRHSGRAVHGLSSVHDCIHQSLPSVTRGIENTSRPLLPSLPVATASFEVVTHAQALPLRVTHAPPGQSALRTDVLRR